MTTRITYAEATEAEVHKFTAFSSDIGVTAAFVAQHGWPKQLDTNMGNGMPFVAITKKVIDGDLMYVRYLQANGCIELKLFND